MGTDQQRSAKKSPNPWKIAFISLSLILVIAAVWLFSKITMEQPGQSAEDTQVTVQSKNQLSAGLSLNNTELAVIANEYMKSEQSLAGYSLEITDVATLKGETVLLGFSIPFALSGEPHATTEGNLQLKVTDISLGGLSLPEKEALSLLAQFLTLPAFVSLDADSETVLMNLTSIDLPKESAIRLLSIDKETKEYSFEVSIPAENLIE
ncbi:YpmS family protein [uncultured Trichococcus sp.]|uniref:YpmS family protein n=1 Tax=uncultured Trichococcus sp. TaxID=189665 RepID=UPI0029C93AA9|nr:YpmS family protein [uncultured Trichococcus sp.]